MLLLDLAVGTELFNFRACSVFSAPFILLLSFPPLFEMPLVGSKFVCVHGSVSRFSFGIFEVGHKSEIFLIKN